MRFNGVTLDEMISAINGRVISGLPVGIKGISTDSRTASSDEAFLALRGERFDGHDFLAEALERAGGAIVSSPPAALPEGKCVIEVPDTLKALHAMARYIREKFNPLVVGITGSNGKTTTKEMLASMLSSRYRVLKNSGNLNNQIGLPMSLLGMGPADEVAVLEMGASAPGDIAELCEIALPGYGALTNIGHAHMEGFGQIGAVRQCKLEMLGYVGSVAVNADDAFLMEGLNGYAGRVVRYGIDAAADVKASDVELGSASSSFTLSLGSRTCKAQIKVPGLFNVYNALSASAVAHMLGLEPEQICQGLRDFSGVAMRSEIKGLRGAMVISDVYNANPDSMLEALKELLRLKGRRAIAVLGDMLELGGYSDTAHRALGQWMASSAVDMLIAVGPNMALAAEEFQQSGKTAIRAADPNEAREILLGHLGQGDTVLVKGSRSMRMELVIENGANGRAGVAG